MDFVDGDPWLGSMWQSRKSHDLQRNRADIAEVVLVRPGDPADHIVFELWRPGQDVRR